MAAPFTYFTRTLANASPVTIAGPQIVARREAGESNAVDMFPGAARYQYQHASTSAGVGDLLPTGSTLVATKGTD